MSTTWSASGLGSIVLVLIIRQLWMVELIRQRYLPRDPGKCELMVQSQGINLPVLIGVTQVFVLHTDWVVVSTRIELPKTRAYKSSIENDAMPPESQQYPTSLLAVGPLALYK